MKLVVVCLMGVLSLSVFAQKDFTPGKRSDAFGKVDYKDCRYSGLQFSAGPTYMFTRKTNPEYSAYGAIRPTTYTNNAQGKLGVFVEAGMLHIPKKRSRLSEILNYVFVSYIDWGIGFKLLGGTETTRVNQFDYAGNQISTADYSGSFDNGFLFGRVTVHKNFYIKNKYFIDNGLGLNFDYNLVRASEASPYTAEVQPYIASTLHHFHHPFVAQLHYNLGVGMKLNRRSMLVVGARTPIMGFHEWRGGHTTLKWFNSNYLPTLFHVKWTWLFEKKAKGCAPAKVNDQDQNTMNKY